MDSTSKSSIEQNYVKSLDEKMTLQIMNFDDVMQEMYQQVQHAGSGAKAFGYPVFLSFWKHTLLIFAGIRKDFQFSGLLCGSGRRE